jgi:hypothetical protein
MERLVVEGIMLLSIGHAHGLSPAMLDNYCVAQAQNRLAGFRSRRGSQLEWGDRAHELRSQEVTRTI